MSDEAAFLVAIMAERDNNAQRLVYADWLEERGRPEGAFLRLECELATTALGQARWHDVFAEYKTASAKFSTEWLGAVGRRDMGLWLAMAARSAWLRLERWCQRHRPNLLTLLHPGATASDIAAIEHAIGQSLPPDVRESFAIHNGANRFILGEDLLTSEDLIWRWQQWRGAEDLNEQVAEMAKSHPEAAIVLAYTIPGWIPLTTDGGGNHLGVDLSPGPAGTVGQVINFGRDEEHKCVLASGWAEFLADFATLLESGAVTVTNTNPSDWGECCQAALGDGHLHDVLKACRLQGRWPLRRPS